MSNYLDPIDKEYIESLFPQYLLEQPVGHRLWQSYYSFRNKFREIHDRPSLDSEASSKQDSIVKNSIIGRIHFKSIEQSKHGLSVELRREIWSSLMNLGVVGTIPFDATNDEYLIQVYKYFYPNDIRVPDTSKPLFPELNKLNSSEDFNQSKPSIPDGDNWDDNGKNKADFIRTDIYHTIGYRMPTEWLIPTNNALITSPDGFSKLNFNPNYHNQLLTGDKTSGSGTISATGASSYARNRPRTDSLNNGEADSNGDKKVTSAGDYTMTWSNNSLSALNLAIFYYEIKVLSVSSSEGGKNSNIIVGFKYSRESGMIHAVYEPGSEYVDMTEAYSESLTSNDTIRSRNRERRRRNRLNQRRRSRGFTGLENTEIGSGIGRARRSNDDYIDPNDDVSESDEDDNENDDDDDMNDDNDDVDDDDNDIDITSGAHPTIAHPRTTGNTETTSTLSGSKPFYGIDDTFFGYNGFDGNAFSLSESEPFAKPFGLNDVIGCGVNYINGTIFFTKNGILLGTAFSEFHDINLVPAIALKPGNSIQTNFGLFEDFTFDILGYQNKWKAKAYSHIYNSASVNHGFSVNTQSKENTNDMMDIDMNDEDVSKNDDEKLPFLLGKDERYDEDGKMNKIEPSFVPINKLNIEDESIPSALNCLINGYLIHEGLTDVAKGFLKDLQNEIESDATLEKTDKTNIDGDINNININKINQKKILRYNERQIIKEEKMLRVRQEMRKLINGKQIGKCIDFVRKQIPGFLETDVETLFELKLAQFYINIENDTSNITKLISEGQDLTEKFVYNTNGQFQISDKLKSEFQERIGFASALLAYNSPLTEAPSELLDVLSPEYFQDILFERINSNALLFLNQTTECALESIVGYTRTMFSTMREYHLEGDQNYEVDPELGLQMPSKSDKNTLNNDLDEDDEDETKLETRYYKIVNLDEDILNLC